MVNDYQHCFGDIFFVLRGVTTQTKGGKMQLLQQPRRIKVLETKTYRKYVRGLVLLTKVSKVLVSVRGITKIETEVDHLI